MSDYTDVIDLLKSEYVEYSGFDFYNYIFPENENAGELHTDYSMPNAIYLYHDVRDEGTRRRMRRRVMLKDCWEADYKEYVENNPMTLCSGLHCEPETVKEEMQATKELWGKTDGRTYKHYVQSYHEDEEITPEQAHKNAVELAEHTKAWKGRENQPFFKRSKMCNKLY